VTASEGVRPLNLAVPWRGNYLSYLVTVPYGSKLADKTIDTIHYALYDHSVIFPLTSYA
jgi:hypothetical protein